MRHLALSGVTLRVESSPINQPHSPGAPHKGVPGEPERTTTMKTVSDFPMTGGQFLQGAYAGQHLTVPRIYLRMMDGDWYGAKVLEELVYLFSPGSPDEDPRLNLNHRGVCWFVRSREEWLKKHEMTDGQFRRVLAKLKRMKLIKTCQAQTRGPIPHLAIWVDEKASVKLFNETLAQLQMPTEHN